MSGAARVGRPARDARPPLPAPASRSQRRARESGREASRGHAAELGETDAPVEDELTEAFDTIVSEGAQRLHRTWREVLTTGSGRRARGGHGRAGAVRRATPRPAATCSAGLAFSIGFIALLLARSELFTEGFLVPVTAVVAGRAGAGQLGKLWGGTLVANLVGGWLVTWLIVTALPAARADGDRVGDDVRRRAAGPAVGLPGAAGRQHASR